MGLGRIGRLGTDEVGGLAPRGAVEFGVDKLNALTRLDASGEVNQAKLPLIDGVMPGDQGNRFPRTRDAVRVDDRRREHAVVPVVFRLGRAVWIHRKQRMKEKCGAVIVLPAGENDSAVLQNLGIAGHELVGRQAADIAAVGIAGINVPAGAVPAIANMHVARRREDDTAIRQECRLAIRDGQGFVVFPEGECDLGHSARRHIHRIEVIGAGIEGVSHGKHQRASVPGEIWVADRAFGLFKQHLILDRAVLENGRHAELPAPFESEGVIADLLVRQIVFPDESLHTAEYVMLGIDKPGGLLVESLKARFAPCGAGVEIERAPAWIASGNLSIDKPIQPPAQRVQPGLVVGNRP